MRIVHVINRFSPNIGGAEAYVHMLSKKLIELGHEVYVVTTTSMKFRGIEGSKLPRSEIMEGIRVVRAPAYLSGPGLVLSPSIHQVIRAVKDVDIYNIHGLLSNISLEAMFEIRRKLGKPSVLTTHDIEIAENLTIYLPLWRLYIHNLGQYLLKNVDAIISQNPEDASFIIKILGISPARVHIIANGVDKDFFDPLKVKDEERRTFIRKVGIEGRRILLFVGRLEARKRIDLLLLAMRLIVKECKDAILLVVGSDQGMLSKLVAFSKNMGLENHVKFCGRLTDKELRTAYAVSDISVSLSAQEAFGLALVESMMMGKAVVSHRWKGIKYIIEDGVNGLLVDPFDYEGLAKKVLYLLENDCYRASLGKKARDYATNNFSLDIMAHRVIHIYNSILSV